MKKSSKTCLQRKVILFSILLALFFSSIISNNISQIDFNSNYDEYDKDVLINPKKMISKLKRYISTLFIF